MSRFSMGIPDFFQPGEQGGPDGARERFDQAPPFHVFVEGGSGEGGRESISEETASEGGDD
ncbi:hypothetical protein Hanom_Chr05g00408891 [Helianthus anomalus]